MDDIYFIGKWIGNMIIIEFTNKKIHQKKIYWHNFIGLLIYIIDGMNLSMIYILLVVFSIIFFKFSELSDSFNSSIILYVIVTQANYIFYIKMLKKNDIF
jgi:hypothetical protein